MSSIAEQIRAWHGPALLTCGFRPFFFGAGLWAVVAMLLWVPMLNGLVTLPAAFDPVSWHAHEFLFGYLGAVVAGFLLTAVPNWTGRLPIVWLAARRLVRPLDRRAGHSRGVGVDVAGSCGGRSLLPRPSGCHGRARRAGKGAQALRAAVAASADLHTRDLAPVVADIRASGATSLRAIAHELTARGMLTRRGGRWHVSTVMNLLDRLGLREAACASPG